MDVITLVFPSLNAMIDFSIFSSGQGYDLNIEAFTLTGSLPESDVELAVNGFAAIIFLHQIESC